MTSSAPDGAQGVDAGPLRYGVFLRPSPELIEESLRAYRIVVDQFGFTAANAYPPHVTIVGSIALAPGVAEDDLVDAVSGAIAGRCALPLVNHGMRGWNDSIGYRIDDDPGASTPGLRDLMGSVLEALKPLRVFPPSDRTTAARLLDSPQTFDPHLSLLGHDGKDNPAASAECLEVLEALGIGAPSTWSGEWVTLYRLHAQDWTDRYWDTMTWQILRSWRLA